MKTILIGCVVAMSLLAQTAAWASCSEKAGIYSYTYLDMNPEHGDPTFGHSFRIELQRYRIAYGGGHAGDGFSNTFCKANDPLFCFQSGRFSFAVPKASISAGQTWTSFGRIYTAKAAQPLALMGVRTQVFEIIGDSRFADTNQTYYYSETRGLLAIKRWSKADKSYLFQFSDSGIGYPIRRCAVGSDRIEQLK